MSIENEQVHEDEDEVAGEIGLETVRVPDSEVARQLQDLNDAAFDQLLSDLNALLEMFRSDAASIAVDKAQDIKDIAPLRDHIVNRNNEAYNRTWALIRYVQNLRNTA